jgi:putative membrane protein
MNSKYSWGVIALSLGLVGGLSAQTTTPNTNTGVYPEKPAMTLKHGDKNFIEESAKGAMETIAISRIAVTKATNPQVRAFAEMVVSEHTAASTALTALATAKGVTLPREPNTERWAKKDAKEFDEDYMEKMIDDHQEAVKRLEKQAKSGNDSELTAWASNTLPKYLQHLAKAKDLKRAVD